MGVGRSGQGRSGQEHSGQWPENLFTGLNDFGHSGLSNFILYFFRATSGASCMVSGNQRHHHHAILSVLTLALLVAWSRSKRAELSIFFKFFFSWSLLHIGLILICEYVVFVILHVILTRLFMFFFIGNCVLGEHLNRHGSVHVVMVEFFWVST
jgi:hypothetical protein